MPTPLRLFCLLLLLAGTAQAQLIPQRNNRTVDSLRRVVAQHPADTNGTKALVSLVYNFAYNDTALAGQYARQALRLATRLHDTVRLARIHYNFGTMNGAAERARLSIAHHLLSAKYNAAIGNKLWEGHNYSNIGIRYTDLGEYETAMRYLLHGLRLREAAHDSGGIADSYTRIGQVYVNQHNYPAAQAAYEQSLRRWQALNVPPYILNALNHLSIIHRDAGRYPRALDYIRQGLAQVKQGGDSLDALPFLITLGVIYQKQGQWEAALRPLLRAERLSALAPYHSQQADSDLQSIIGETYVQLGQTSQAGAYLRRALALSKAVGAREEEIDALEGLATLAAKQGDFRAAYTYQHDLSFLKDTLRSDAAARSVTEMQARYETEQKDARNRIQQLEIGRQRLVLRQRNAQLLAAGAALLLVVVAGWSLYKRRALRQQLELEQQRQGLERQRAAAVLEAEENERRRIGSDLHDGIGQLLTAAKLNLHALGQQLGPASDGAQASRQLLLDNAVEVVDESFREVRSISHNLMPNALLKRGLAAAVRDFLDKLPSGNGLRVEVEAFGLDDMRLDPTVESVLFRVIQELVQNIVKHAHATDVTLQLVKSDDELTVVVEDNGVGFDPQALGPDAGIGLRNVATRMAYLGGRAHFDGVPGRGTTVTLEVPLAAAVTAG
ncbi:tetratricopeptide repeat protein [Hymenobacter busanensis]|uniref:Oxygen sensor histidine kinase NreB n=1 Tax=Hymenobacter busanensis TaxID=2607656 RepID=A0A7L4ZXN4_9BACT|nr:tetratricopeptide repeat protein [Hymenobacter busanensis]KAA9332086.1 tetratricopeptide repeat protein [Hymenobacter busanensis]QHJ07575.1 tetratricopeptide repeat protein [Hymenobacter busanensis]